MTREELKQADTKKLISALQYCGRDSYYATYYAEVVDEITQRLKRIEELEKQIEKMKCCGNCSHRHYWGNELGCNLDYDKEDECNHNNKKYWEFEKE